MEDFLSFFTLFISADCYLHNVYPPGYDAVIFIGYLFFYSTGLYVFQVFISLFCLFHLINKSKEILFSKLNENKLIEQDETPNKKAELRDVPPIAENNLDNTAILRILQASQNVLLANCFDNEKASDGNKWKKEIDQDGIKIYSASVTGKKYKLWKTVVRIQAQKDNIFTQLFDLKQRVEWDSAILSGEEVFKHFFPADESRFSVNKIRTQPQGGGSVSSREIVSASLKVAEEALSKHSEAFSKDVALIVAQKDFSDQSHIKELIHNIEGSNESLSQLLKKDGKVVRAELGAGIGTILEKISDAEHICYSVSAIDLKGWLPASVINAATASAMQESAKLLVERLRSLSA